MCSSLLVALLHFFTFDSFSGEIPPNVSGYTQSPVGNQVLAFDPLSSPSFPEGILGNAISFPNSQEHQFLFNYGTNAGTAFTLDATGGRTASFWFKLDVVDNEDLTIAGIWNTTVATNCQWRVFTRDGDVYFGYQNATNGVVDSVIQSGASTEWTQVTIRYNADGNHLRVAVNGEAQIDGIVTSGLKSVNALLYFCSAAGEQAMFGKVDEFGFWGREVMDCEVTDLYNSGAGKTYPFSE